MANEVMQEYAFLTAYLRADSTLMALVTGAWGDVAPEGSVPDWVIFGSQSALDTNTAFGTRVWTRNLFRVFAVGPVGHGANLAAIADRLDALLQPSGRPLVNTTAGGVTVAAIVRESGLVTPASVPGSVSGPEWLNVGGLYRLEK